MKHTIKIIKLQVIISRKLLLEVGIMRNWILRGKENSKEYTIGRIGSSHCLRTEIEQPWRRPLPFLS